jgi:hypothetical protein
MKKVTNYTGGLRGITLKASKEKDSSVETKWVEPGEEAEYDPALLVGELPDFGKKPDADAEDDGLLAVAEQENADLRAKVAELTAKLDAAGKSPAK